MTFNTNLSLSVLAALALTACGGSSDSENVTDNNDKPAVDTIYGPLSTGAFPNRVFAYFDLETMTQITLTDEEAATNTDWDIAFKGTDVYLNYNNTQAPVSLYFTGNNADFFDAAGTRIDSAFVNATAESELADFDAVSTASIPTAADAFIVDSNEKIINGSGGFYTYNTTSHQVSANQDNFFIVNSDDTITKFRVTDITTSGFVITNLTLKFANQGLSADAFDTTETEVMLDATDACNNYSGVYIDFDDSSYLVSSTDAWDISLPCGTAGADFEIDIADDATARRDFDNLFTGIPRDSIVHYNFQPNEVTEFAFKALPWYTYAPEGGIAHGIYSQFGVYLIKTSSATYKFQITSYYDSQGGSGNYSFRAAAL
ncbi:HmuY family protein [Catenovulum maritimum]|uniref:HmuY protein n=1 Tax=Catenovulum maritimum TaxID=1513271 RepID=A0A0J8JHR7_9ALTE|nr:HmuY family protein [Catenovulum maritimum]KMT63976.1 hypothetical protein XM47_16845 [Catenovulum maritimum]